MADFQRVYSSMSASSSYSEGTLDISIVITFKPFDVRDYLNQFPNTTNPSVNKLRWMYSTIYNYIPVALIRNNSPGINPDIESGSWSEIDVWDYSSLEISEGWGLGTLGRVEQNLYVNDLRGLAEDTITHDPNWYKTDIGKTFAFSNAFNGNILFSHLTPYNDFTNLVHQCANNPAAFDSNLVWDRQNAGRTFCKVSMHIVLEDVGDDEDRTYAVVSADPSSNSILTRYIYITSGGAEPVDRFEYVDGSFGMTGAENNIGAAVSQVSDKRVRIDLSMLNTQWRTLSPQIRFKVKHITS